MPATLSLTPDELLTTTRSVRKRLDLSREVPDEVIRECVGVALQAPAGSNVARTRFVIVRRPAVRRALADIYGQIYESQYRSSAGYIGSVKLESAEDQAQQERTARSADALPTKLADVPAIVIACLAGGRVDGAPAFAAASFLGGVLPAMWSFMLAARARGLGTAWTTMHLAREREVADLLGIPYDTVQQVCLSPLAYTVGTDFKPGRRPSAEDVIHWDGWDADKPVPPPMRGTVALPAQ
jgi:nitroreductase